MAMLHDQPKLTAWQLITVPLDHGLIHTKTEECVLSKTTYYRGDADSK